MPIPKRKTGESQSDFMQRCMSDDKMISEYDQDQRLAVCRYASLEKLATEKISFDFDGTLSTQRGLDMAINLVKDGATVYIISARQEKDGMLPRANKAGIHFSNVYATGSNQAKIDKIKELGITTHYDNNKDVVDALPNVGKLF